MIENHGWEFDVQGCGTFSSASTEQKADAKAMAVEFLWLWTGGVFGLEEVTEFGHVSRRPTQNSNWSTFRGPLFMGNRTSLVSRTRLELTGLVQEVIDVTVNGQPLDSSRYVVQGHTLVRTDGEPWPTERGAVSVLYVKGLPLPVGGRRAAEVLACEFAKAFLKDSGCQLPRRIQQITRQGVTAVMMDDFKGLEDGKTGIWIVDSWVQSVTQARVHSSVISPDLR